jgi:hypothetical protein
MLLDWIESQNSLVVFLLNQVDHLVFYMFTTLAAKFLWDFKFFLLLYIDLLVKIRLVQGFRSLYPPLLELLLLSFAVLALNCFAILTFLMSPTRDKLDQFLKVYLFYVEIINPFSRVILLFLCIFLLVVKNLLLFRFTIHFNLSFFLYGLFL